MRAWRVVPVLLLASLVLSGCGSNSVRVIRVHVAPDDTELMVTVDACDDKASVDMESSIDEVRLSASVPRNLSTTKTDCLTEVLVPLDEPLARRSVVDESSDLEVPVEAADGHENFSSDGP